jgi:hypothetical protein
MTDSAVAVMVFGIAGCGASPPTAANDMTDSEQQKFIIRFEIVTPADNAGITVD